MHAVEPSKEYWPAAQSVQDVASMLLEKVLGLHSAHLASEMMKEPGKHVMQPVALLCDVMVFPAGHSLQGCAGAVGGA